MKNKGLLIFITSVVAASIVVSVIATGCSKQTEDAEGDDVPPGELVELLCEDVDVPDYEVIPLDEENFAYYAFIDYEEGMSAVAADALINITPHSLVVIHSSDGNGKDIAGRIVSAADPNKWISTGSDIVYVGYTDHYVVLVMSFLDVADGIIENFKTIANDLNDGEYNIYTATNPRYDENI